MNDVERKKAYRDLRVMIGITFDTWMECYGKDYTLNDCTKEIAANLYTLKKLEATGRYDRTVDDFKELAVLDIYMELLRYTSNLRVEEAEAKFIKSEETED